MWDSQRIHKELREVATTLAHFRFIQISVIIFFSWLCYDWNMFYKEITTPETFNATAFWAAMSANIAAIFTAVKFLNDKIDKNKE